MSVHREGENPSSMDGVSDLRDHNSFGELKLKHFCDSQLDVALEMTFTMTF